MVDKMTSQYKSMCCIQSTVYTQSIYCILHNFPFRFYEQKMIPVSQIVCQQLV